MEQTWSSDYNCAADYRLQAKIFTNRINTNSPIDLQLTLGTSFCNLTEHLQPFDFRTASLRAFRLFAFLKKSLQLRQNELLDLAGLADRSEDCVTHFSGFVDEGMLLQSRNFFSSAFLILSLLSIRLERISCFQNVARICRKTCHNSKVTLPTALVIKKRSHNICFLLKALNQMSDDSVVVDDAIFGSEFKPVDSAVPSEEKTYWRGNIQYTEISPEKRGKIMKGYDNLRITFLLDNLFISVLGLCLLWSFGTYKDAFSYGVGSLLGLGYAALLARYVESLGSKQGGGAGGGAARFAPVVLLILLYSKNKEFISIVPEILGFFTFQVASLLQIFNEDAYGESEQS